MTLLTTSAMWAQDYDDYDDEEFGDYFSATIEGVEWQFVIIDEEEKTCAICHVYDELSGEVTLPSEVQYGDVTYTVTAIGEGVFNNCESLTSVSIGDGVVTIGAWAFAECGLTSVTIPNSVTNLGGGAFEGCESLTSVSIGNGVTAIEEYVFGGCSSLASINIGSGVTTIDESAFSGCNAITSIVIDTDNPKYDSRNNCNAIIETATNTLVQGFASTVIPDGVTTIGDAAFLNCNGLTSFTIPNSVTTIGNWAFQGCNGLTSITIPNSVATIGYSPFYGCDNLKTVSLNCPTVGSWFANDNNIEEIIIGSEVKTIESGAFYGCRKITTFTIPATVTSIGSEAFVGIESISVEDGNPVYDSRDNCNAVIETATNTLIIGSNSTKVPSSVTAFGDYAFVMCDNLKSIYIPASMTSIGRGAFGYCPDIESIIVDEDNTVYDSRQDCNAIIETATNTLVVGCKNTDIPVSIKTIGNTAFLGADLVSVNIPDGVVVIGEASFYQCDKLESVTIPSSVTTISRVAFYGCSSLLSVEIPSSVSSLGNAAFTFCTSLIRAELPSNLNEIPDDLFEYCESLASITIPSTVKSIGSSAFEGCSSLRTISIPGSVSSIGERAFADCGLEKIYSYIEEPSELQDNDFHYNGLLYVPEGTREKYKEKWHGCYYADIIEMNKITLANRMETYASSNDLDFTEPIEGLKAYVVSEVNDEGKAVLEEVNGIVYYGTGLLLIGTPGQTYWLPQLSRSTSVDYSSYKTYFGSWWFPGVTEDTPIGGNNRDYILKDGKFVKALAGTLKAGKAYLRLDHALGREVIGIDGMATGIAEIESTGAAEDRRFYNLGGQRVSQPRKGLYIVNGKKVIK